MILINVTTKELVSEKEFREIHQETLFPSEIKDSHVVNTDYLVVKVSERPEVNPWQTTSLGDVYIKSGIATRDWEVVNAPLDEIKKQKYAEINRARDVAASEGVLYDGATFDCDISSLIKIFPLGIMREAPPTGFWTDFNNNDIHGVDGEWMAGLMNAIIARGSEIHAAQRMHKKAIDELVKHKDVYEYEYSL